MRTWLWSAVYSLVSFFNDRLLPDIWHFNPESVADRFQHLWHGLLTYVTEQPDAPKRYRGVIIDESESDNLAAVAPVITRTVYYRGCPIQRTPSGQVAFDLSSSAYIPPYQPPYQRWMNTQFRTWLLNLGLGNRDLTSPTPATEKVYRGSRY